MNRPLARKEGIHIEQLQDEVILYDKANHHAYRLNRTVFAVWENADGSRTVEELTEFLSEKPGVQFGRDIVLLAIDDLVKANLMSTVPEAPSQVMPSRRDLAKKLALAGASASALPFIASILAPLPAMARSYTPPTATSYTPGTFRRELRTATLDFEKDQGWKSDAAVRDFEDALTEGSAGLTANEKGKTALSEADFAKAEADFDEMLKALGLPLL